MKDKRNISIARKLIIYFVFSSLIIASIGTSVSLYRDYQAHKKRVQDKFKQIIEFPSISNKHINYLIISFSSDWLFLTRENRQIVEILNHFTRKVSFTEISTDKGHDSFLLDEPELDETIKGFLTSNFKKLDK